MKHICPGPPGLVYGVDETGCLLRAPEAGGPWTLLPGRYSQVAWSAESGPIGVDLGGRLVRVTEEGPRPAAEPWSKLRVTRLSVGSDGTIWALDEDSDTGAVRGRIDRDWSVVPGPLDDIDGATFEQAYGVAEQGRAFVFDRNGWEPDRRGVCKIVGTAEGAKWAIRRDSKIERWNGRQWQSERGLLVDLVAASARRLWGLNKHGHVWQLKALPEAWKKLSGEARSVAADGCGRLATVDGAGVLRELRETQWWRLRREVRSVALAPEGDMWIVDRAGSLMRRTEDGWLAVPVADSEGKEPAGGVFKVSAGEGELWLIDGQGRPWQRLREGEWQRRPGELLSVSVGNAHAIWAIDLQERALRWSDGAWVVVQEGIRELDVGSDGELWAVGAEDRLYRWEPGSGFLVEPGRLRTIAVGHAHYVAGATADDQLFSRRGCSWQHHDVRMVPKLPTLTGIEVRRHQLLGVSLACLEIGWRLRLDRDYGDMLEQAAETGHPVVIGLPLGGIRDREHRPRLEMKADDFEFGRAVDVEGLPFVLRHRLRLVHDICELWGLKLLATHERKSQEESESPELPPIWARLRWPGGSATVPES